MQPLGPVFASDPVGLFKVHQRVRDLERRWAARNDSVTVRSWSNPASANSPIKSIAPDEILERTLHPNTRCPRH